MRDESDMCSCGSEPFSGALGLSTTPYERALERIEALLERGEDAEHGTLRRLHATEDPGKIAGIYLAARDYGWKRVMQAAARKYRETTGKKLHILAVAV